VIGTGLFMVWDQFTPTAPRKPVFAALPFGHNVKTDP